MTLADLIAIMRNGVLHQVASPEEIYHRPTDRFVAGFVGSPMMNFVQGIIERKGDDVLLKTGSIALTLGSIGAVPIQQGREVTMGVRPEHFVLCPDGDTELTVEIVETLGSQTFVYGNLAPDQRLAVGVDPELRPMVGDRLRVNPNSRSLHFFSPDSGERIVESA